MPALADSNARSQNMIKGVYTDIKWIISFSVSSSFGQKIFPKRMSCTGASTCSLNVNPRSYGSCTNEEHAHGKHCDKHACVIIDEISLSCACVQWRSGRQQAMDVSKQTATLPCV